jgi:beta-phosphoglucomutase family hydrolase
LSRDPGRLSSKAPNRLGLPPRITACLFDLDGVVTKTAIQHARAWKQVFEQHGIAFDEVSDYDAYVDGKPREEGVRSLLASRNIRATDDLVEDIAADKDRLFLELIHKEGVQTYPSSVDYIKAAKDEGLKVAVVSSSRHTTDVLEAAHLTNLFDAQVDGIVAEHEHLLGKPDPDTYLKAAEELDAAAQSSAVYEDALAGVEAGRAGHFGLVVGVDRAGQRDALKQHGADIVVEDLGELMR